MPIVGIPEGHVLYNTLHHYIHTKMRHIRNVLIYTIIVNIKVHVDISLSLII